MNKTLYLCLTVSVISTVLSCSSSKKDSTKTVDGASLQLNVVTSGNAVEGLIKRKKDLVRGQAPVSNIGQTTTESIESLQYFVREIQLCKELTINGTAYSNPQGCITLYQTSDSSVFSDTFYNTYTVSDAIGDTAEGHFVDLLTPAGRSALRTPVALTTNEIGIYKYGKIDYQRPIKIRASFKNALGTSIFFTKTPTASEVIVSSLDSGGRERDLVRPSNTTSGSAETMTYMLDNGGAWFAFAKPFEITSADIDSRSQIFLDFVFNPEGFATATYIPGCAASTDTIRPVIDIANCVYFDLPYAKFAPVPRKQGEVIKKEVYLMDYVAVPAAEASKVRIELYFNDTDSTKAILGIDSAVLFDGTATTTTQNIVGGYVATESSNKVTFFGYNQATSQLDATVLSNLERRVDGTASVTCTSVGGPCVSADGSTISKSYRYLGTETVTVE